ncbi:hypothetical protein Tco_1072084 [Tanacetum coccineum]
MEALPGDEGRVLLDDKRNQERVKSIFLLAIPDDYLLKFHNVPDVKSLWAAIKSRFEKLISQLEIHGAYVSKEDINQKFLRSLHPLWSQITLIMRNKLDIDEIDIDDLYNNLRVYEDEMKKSSTSSSNTQNLAFLSSENTNSTNEVSTVSGDFGVSAVGGINQVPTTPCAHDIAYSFLAQPTTNPQLKMRIFQQMDWNDFEELSIECNDFELEPVNYALMAISSSNSSSSSDSVVQKCSKKCLESFKCLQKNYDTEREKHNKAKLKIRGYEIALESLESRILGHEKNELAWGEKYEFQNYDLKTSDEESTPTNDTSSKKDGYKVVPPPITGNFLTPRADISFAGLDEYAIRNKIIKSQTSKLNTKTSETLGQTNAANTVKPKSANESVKANPKINRDKVIIKDWTSGLVNPVRTNGKRAVHTVSTARPISTARPVSTARPFAPKIAQTGSAIRVIYPRMDNGNPEICLQDHAVVDSGCSSHMTDNKAYLSDYEDYNRGFVAFGSDPKGDYEDYNGGFVAFGSDPKGGKITGKGKIRTANLDFDDVYFVDELNFKLLDENQVVLRAPRQNDVYSLDLKNIVPSGGD